MKIFKAAFNDQENGGYVVVIGETENSVRETLRETPEEVLDGDDPETIRIEEVDISKPISIVLDGYMD